MATVSASESIETLLESLEVQIDHEELHALVCDQAMFDQLDREFKEYVQKRRASLYADIAFLHDVDPDFMRQFWGFSTH